MFFKNVFAEGAIFNMYCFSIPTDCVLETGWIKNLDAWAAT